MSLSTYIWVIDNSDCSTTYQHHFATQAEAEQMLAALTEKARAVESEPCQIESQMECNADGVTLTASFHFSCQAETLIFQLALR
ncbi:MAG: YfcZ/YiiS family protein [Enterobacteriaceae bacterium]